MATPPLASTDLARLALRRIAELKQPPTPENFERFYREASGEIGVSGTAMAREIVERAEELVSAAASTAGHLAAGLDERNDELSAGLDGLVGTIDGEPGSVAEIVSSTREILSLVRSSHAELMQTRRRLDDLKAELDENRKLLVQDPLTGTSNRRAMEPLLEREIANARRRDEPLAVAMVDIDHFKAINDKHGHAAGDAALVHLTRIANSVLRGHDAFVRYGGEEFVLVLPGSGMKGAVSAAERLQSLLARTPLQHGSVPIPMTFSAGVAELNAQDSQQTMLQRADLALYRAKNAGRNKVLEANVEPDPPDSAGESPPGA